MAKKQKSINLPTSEEFRALAEEGLKQKHLSTGVSTLSTTSSPEEMLRVVHELEVCQTELAIQHEKLTRILRATTLCNEALIHSTDEMELLQKICNIVVDIGGYRMAWIGYAEHDKAKRIRPIARSGFEEGYLESVTISWDDTESGRGPTGTAIRTGKPITSTDIIHDPRMNPWRSEAIKRGYSSSLSLPMKADHEVFGALSIYSAHPDAFNAEAIELLITLADNLAYGISMLRTRQARQKVQDELSRSNELMHFTMQATNAGFWQHDLSTNTSTFSDEVWKLYGLKPNSHENAYDAWISTIIPEDREAVELTVQEALKTNGEYSCRWRVLNPDGTFRWLQSKGTPVKDSKAQVVGYAGLVLDITDQKKKEDALAESEQRFTTLFEKHSSIMLIIDPDTGRIVKANNAAAAFYGWPIDQLCQMHIQQINTLSSEEIRSAMEKSRTGEQNHFFFQHRIANKSVRDIEVFSITIDIGGKGFLYSIIHDITERKLAEQALQASETKFRSITEQMAEYVFLVDSIGTLIYASPVIEKLFGYLPYEVIGHPFIDYIPEEDIPKALEVFSNNLQLKTESLIYELKLKRKDSSIFDGEIHLQYYEDQDVSGMIGLIHDITDRKLAENQLKKLSAAVEQSPASTLITDQHGNIEYVNDSFTRITGYAADDIIGKTPRILESDLTPKAVYENLWETVMAGQVWIGELSIKKKNGETFWESVVMSSLRNNNGQVTNILSVAVDITERKLAENELKQSEERFRKFFEGHSSVMLIIDPYTGSIIDANPAAEDFYGWSIEELRRMSMREINTIAPEGFMAKIEEIRSNSNKQYSFQHRRADGSIRDVESFPNVIQIGGKELVYAIIHDITAQKDAEHKIRDYVRQLEGSMKSTLQAVAKVVEAHDPYTAGHELRVGQISEDIAREMGWSEERCNTLQLIGLVHDIGKMSIPSQILSKPGQLSAIEFELIKTHAEQGYQILKNVEFPLPIAEIIREHHERMDGTGYPQGLKGEQILMEARILAVADVLEAMASHRPYRASFGIDAAISEIETNRGNLFDTDVVDAMLRLFREKNYQLPDVTH